MTLRGHRKINKSQTPFSTEQSGLDTFKATKLVPACGVIKLEPINSKKMNIFCDITFVLF